MDNNIFHSAFDKVFGAVKGVASATGKALNGALADVFGGGGLHYVQAQEKPAPVDTFDNQKMMNAIRYNETRGVKEPYGYSRYSGSKTQGRANGAYQVTDEELKTYGPKFLGKPVTSEEFLSNPSLQDNYMMAKIQHGRNDLNLSPEQILATHRGGYSNPEEAMVKYKGYVNSGMQQFNQ